MKKALLISFALLLLLSIAHAVSAAPVYTIQRSILPETDSQYYIGTTTPSNLRYNGTFNNLTVSGTCSGCGQPFPTSTNPLMASYFVGTSTGTTTLAGGLNVSTSGGNLGVAYSNPDATIVAGQTTTVSAPTGLSLTTSPGGGNYSFSSGDKNYSIYTYRTIDGITFYSPSGLSGTYIEVSSTDYDPTSLIPTAVNPGAGGYSPSANPCFEVYAVYGGAYRSISTTGSVCADDPSNSFDVDIQWTAPVDTTNLSTYIVVRNDNQCVDTSGSASLYDGNSSWTSCPSYSSLTYGVTVSWNSATNATGYRALDGTNETYNDTISTSITDDSTWASGSTVTPSSGTLLHRFGFSSSSNPYAVYSSYGNGYFGGNLLTGGSLGVGTSSPYRTLGVVGSAAFRYMGGGGISTIETQCASDGGFATYGCFKWSGGGSNNYILGILGGENSATPSYGVFSLFGDRTLNGGRIGEWNIMDRALAGDQRAITLSGDYSSSNSTYRLDVSKAGLPTAFTVNATNLRIGVGGVTDPKYGVHVTGAGVFSSFVDASFFKATSTATSTNAGDYLVRGIGAWSYLSGPSVQATSTTATSTFQGGIMVGTAASSTFVVDRITNHVGVGSTTPWAKHSIAGKSTDASPLFSISSSTQAGATTTVFHISSQGRVGIGTSSPAKLLDVYSTGTTTVRIDANNSTKGSCLVMKDVDGAGYTYITAANGVLTASTVSCE
jgi:hypothetical protein